MRLKAVIIEGFRAYGKPIRIELGDLTAFVGRNDTGKSTILEALSIFFGSGDVEIDCKDACVHRRARVAIGAVFSELPREVVLDASAKTSLGDEYLLNKQGELEIHKVYDCNVRTKVKADVFAVAMHPQGDPWSNLLQKKNPDLKALIRDSKIEPGSVDQRSDVDMRRALWASCPDLTLSDSSIPLDVEGGKRIWAALEKELPLYALFKSDRPSQDEDPEVQDPLKFAVKEAIKSLGAKLAEIDAEVKRQTQDVADRTLTKLKEMDPNLAAELSPDFKAERKWESVFKFALTCDNGVPLNKRGSGARRLVLLNFFRAQAERKRSEDNSPGVIYAVEEPETSQHPTNQKMIADALMELASQDNRQVLITTHVPGLAGLLPAQSLRHVKRVADGAIAVESGRDEDILRTIAADLGVLAGITNEVRLVVCVEGQTDISFLKNIAAVLRRDDSSIIDLEDDRRVVMIPLGGSSLKEWVQRDYLKKMNLREFHIYDRGTDTHPKYQADVDRVNARGNGSNAVLTTKPEIENYLHRAAILAGCGVDVELTDSSAVPQVVARAIHESAPDSKPWDEVDEDKRKQKVNVAKRNLCSSAASRMTRELLEKVDTSADIRTWLGTIRKMVEAGV